MKPRPRAGVSLNESTLRRRTAERAASVHVPRLCLRRLAPKAGSRDARLCRRVGLHTIALITDCVWGWLGLASVQTHAKTSGLGMHAATIAQLVSVIESMSRRRASAWAACDLVEEVGQRRITDGPPRRAPKRRHGRAKLPPPDLAALPARRAAMLDLSIAEAIPHKHC